MKHLKKSLSLLLSFLMIVTAMASCLVLIPDLRTSADAASVRESQMTFNELRFVVPEVIYCYPDAVAQAVTRSHTFEYYVNNNQDGTANPSYDTMGRIYFAYPTAANTTLSYRFVNNSFSALSGGSIMLSTTTLNTSNTVTINGGATPALAASVNGCWIEWTLSFTDTKDYTAKKAYAYTYVYKPYTIPVAAGADAAAGTSNSANYAGSVTWINGFHSLTEMPSILDSDWDYRYSLYTNMSNFSCFVDPKGSKGYVSGAPCTGSQAKPANSGYTTATNGFTMGYTLFSNTSSSGYYLQVPMNSTPYCFGSSSPSQYTSPVQNFCVGRYRKNERNVQSCVMTNTYGNITIDTSRYSDLAQIPQLGIGMIVTDDENSHENSATWYIADYTGRSTNGYTTWHTGIDTRDSFYNDYGYKIAGQGNSATDCNFHEREGVYYAGAWPRTLLGNTNVQGATQMYMAKGFYGNYDRGGLGGDYYASGHTVVKMQATYRNKSALRAAVTRTIKLMPQLGVNGISNGAITSCYFDATTGYNWATLQNAYRAAVIALTQVDNQSNMDVLAANLNNAINSLCTSVVLNANGGTLNAPQIRYINIGTNTSVNFTTSDVPVRNGYIFLGWNKNPNATNGAFSVNVGYNNTLYAIWEEQPPVHEHFFMPMTIDSTCNVQGISYSICLDCDEIINYTVLPFAEHTFGDWETTVAPTCNNLGTETRTCAVCDIEQNREIPMIEHTFGEWTVVHDATIFEEGIAERVCTACEYTELQPIPQLPSETITDDDTNVTLIVPDDAFDGDIDIEITEAFDGSSFQVLNKVGVIDSRIFDINIYIGNEKVQPATGVWVKIPVPAGFDPSMTVIYYVSNTGVIEKIDSTIRDGYIIFEATHFSNYAVVDEGTMVEPGEEPQQPTPTCSHICHKDGFAGFIWKIINFFNRLFKLNPVCECGEPH